MLCNVTAMLILLFLSLGIAPHAFVVSWLSLVDGYQYKAKKRFSWMFFLSMGIIFSMPDNIRPNLRAVLIVKHITFPEGNDLYTWGPFYHHSLKLKMFAEGWVVYPRTSGSLEPTWHEALGIHERFVPGGLWGPTRPGIQNPVLGKHLNFYHSPWFTINLQNLRCLNSQYNTETSQPAVHELVQAMTSQ